MGLRIGILYNDTQESLAASLRVLLPEAVIIGFDLATASSNAVEVAAALRGCDHVISQDVAPRFGLLATRALVGSARRLHVLPPLQFRGFHPDMLTVHLDDVPVAGPTGFYHSRVAIAAYLAGIAPEDAAGLFNSLVFARLGYFDALRGQQDAAVARYAAYGIDLAAALPQWIEAGCFMHTPDHPKMRVMMELARLACMRMDVQPAAPEALPADPLVGQPSQPYFPELAARNGLAAEGAFRGFSGTMTALEFMTAGVQALQRVPLSRLRAAPGVLDAMAALDMQAAAWSPRRAMPGAVGLLSWHGTIVRLERASGLLVQEKPWPDSPDCVDFTLTPQDDADGIRTADVLPGLEIVPGLHTGTSALRRAGKFMSSDPSKLAMPFRAEVLGDWEGFLMPSQAQIAALRRILSQRWSCEAPACRMHPAQFRFVAGFIVSFGPFSVDLRRHMPVEREDGGLTLQTDIGTVTIQPIAGPDEDDAIALVRVGTAPPEAASLAAFRSAGPASWTIEAAEEILHPPLTISEADAAWVFDASAAPLPFGLYRPRLAVRRLRGTALLHRDLGGCVLDAGGVLHPGPDGVPGTLPPGFRWDCGVMTAERGILTQGPAVEGPVAVIRLPDSQDAGSWLLDAAIPLHVMAPYWPPGTQVLVPSGETRLGQPGGLGAWPVLEITDPVCQLLDGIWLDHDGIADVPAAMLRDFRARHAALDPDPAPARHIIVQRGAKASLELHPRLEKFLHNRGFETVDLAALTHEARVRLFQQAETIIAASGPELAYLVFCAEGAQVLELAPVAGFQPLGWVLCEKMGLVHGVLPCPTILGAQQADLKRTRALLRVVRGAAKGAEAE
jgi:hypothetical protein